MVGVSAAAAEWLEQALMELCADTATGLHLDPDVVTSLVSYCQLAPPSDAAEYLTSIFGQEQSEMIAAEYLNKREGTNSTSFPNDPGTKPLQTYVKSKAEAVWSASSKKVGKTSKKKNGLMGGQGGTLGTPCLQGQSDSINSFPNAARSKPRTKKAAKAVSLAEGAMLFPRGGPCNCQASRHKLISNCLSCGKVVCEQEGEGPCNFCGTLVLKDESDYAGLEGGSLTVSEAEAAAKVFKDRLVEYNKNSALRTTVIDDQSDYFETEGNWWISDQDKQHLKKRHEEAEQAESQRRRQMIVTIDLLGRKVVKADHGREEPGRGESVLLESTPCDDEGLNVGTHMMPNPYIMEMPRFVEAELLRQPAKTVQNRQNRDKLLKSGRIQHNDPVASTLLSRDSRATLESVDNTWEGPKSQEDFTFSADDGDEIECKSQMR